MPKKRRISGAAAASARKKSRRSGGGKKRRGGRRRGNGGGGSLKSLIWGGVKAGAMVAGGIVVAEVTRGYLTAPKKDGSESYFGKLERENPGTMGVLMSAIPGALAAGGLLLASKHLHMPKLRTLAHGTIVGAAAVGGVRLLLRQPAVALRTQIQVVDKTPQQLAAQKAGAQAAGQPGNGLMAPGSATGGGDLPPILPSYSGVGDAWAPDPRAGDSWAQDPRVGDRMTDEIPVSGRSAWDDIH